MDIQLWLIHLQKFTFNLSLPQNIEPLSSRNTFGKDFMVTSVVFSKVREQISLAIGGVADHIHIFFIYKPNVLLSDLVRDIKRDSSAFINDNRFTKGTFRWQKSYGAFSYGNSQINRIIRYVENQEAHHRRKNFQKEVETFLKNFDATDNPYGWINELGTTLPGSQER